MADNQLVPVREENFALGRLQPQSIKELLWFAEQVVQTRMFEAVKEIEKETAKVDWIAQILEAMKAAQVEGKPSADHRFKLSTRGWDGKEKVRAWLTKQPWDMVEEIRNEMM